MKICVLSSGSKGNMTYIEGGNTRLLIDAGITLTSAKRRNKDLNLDNITDIIITHEHGDHISGLNALREHYRFETIASFPCSQRIQNIRSNLSRIFGVYLIFITGERVRDYPRFVCEAADVTFDDRLLFAWREHSMEMVLTPGHSPGSSAIRMDGKILFSGDSLFADREVVVRFDGGSEEEYMNIAKPYYESLPMDTLVYPGHGECFELKDGIFDVAHPELLTE